ncbi:hypothetical protein EJ08DRAFT_17185 [Tothia fuscella]|uniref:Uncharacterized protein n=1 Tax=Tothia fuscella TaxID=1048955 RepID=A0A9P4NWY3_9PEZI|nr:hypothetical protein EJ08DRAFT_17185 [Tothia fuscella]
MAWAPSLLIDRLCSKNCNSHHLGPERSHLPIGLWRATHDGSSSGRIPPNSGFDGDGCRRPRLVTSFSSPLEDEVRKHLDKANQIPSPFLSFGTWELVSSRVHMWKGKGVRNIRLHLMAAPLLPGNTTVYRASGFDSTPYYEGEYLVQGEVPASAFLLRSWGGEGKDCLLKLPATRSAWVPGLHSDSVLCVVPRDFAESLEQAGTGYGYKRDHAEEVVYDCNGPSGFLVMSDSITCGKLFTIGDLMEHYSSG